MTPTIIGIDPGISGAIAVLHPQQGTVRFASMRMPVVGEKRRMIDGAACKEFLEPFIFDTDNGKRWETAILALEHVSAMPGQGVTSMFSFGTSFGFWLGFAAAMRIPVRLVRPQTWQKMLIGVGQGDTKERAAKECARRWPGAVNLQVKANWPIADAALIAEYVRLTEGERGAT